MDGKSQNITEEQLAKLKELFPETFSEDKIDWEKLKAALGEDVDLGERYGLSWKGKSNVFRAIQEQTTKTLKPAKNESVDWDSTENLFIEGDNLEALKILHKAYYGKVKMIYIDPPYNTGNDFVYNDKFAQSQREYESEAGIRDDEGNVKRSDGLRKNSKDGGHFHSNWLNMMYPRLYLARNLLKQDGVIFVSIDDNEVHNLRMIMNEIFGEENFVAEIIWEKKYAPQNDAKYFSTSHDYILVYARSIDKFNRNLLPRDEQQISRYKNPDNDSRGVWQSDNFTVATYSEKYDYPIKLPSGRIINPTPGRCWRTSENKFKELIAQNRISFGPEGDNVPRIKRFLSEVQDGRVPTTLWQYSEVGHNQSAATELKNLFDGKKYFDYPKPVSLIIHMEKIACSNDSIILDFFSGSSTTAHAVMELNAKDGGSRRHIQVQLPELTDEKSEAYKAGYKNIADIAKERIRRAGKKIAEDHKDEIAKRKTPLDLGFKLYKVNDSNLKAWNSQIEDAEQLKQQMLSNMNPIVDDADDQDLLTELLLKNGINPNEKIEAKDNFYYINEHKLAICLAKEMSQQLFTKILESKPEKVILLDSAFQNNDQLKANLLLQSEQTNIETQVI